MVIEITSPNGDVSKADVRNSSLDYPQNTPLKSLYSIHISSSGTMEKGTSFMMMNYKNLQIGAWAFKLTHQGYWPAGVGWYGHSTESSTRLHKGHSQS